MGLLDKAKGSIDKVKDSTEKSIASAKDASSKGMDLIQKAAIQANEALPVLKHNGYNLTSLEIGVGLPPSITAAFSFEVELTEEMEASMLAELENNKIGTMFVKGLSQANKLQKNIAIDNLKYDEVEIEASIPPSVTLIFH
ncbi:MAG TPA: hypothetical protein EYQ77_09095 [Methylococcaceae bacterium]|nr:hypothetical protein [Methylococcaceae bacterium]